MRWFIAIMLIVLLFITSCSIDSEVTFTDEELNKLSNDDPAKALYLEEGDLVGQAIKYKDLTSKQKRAFWGCWKESCYSKLKEAQETKDYNDYRSCSLGCFDSVKEEKVDFCQDSDELDFITKGVVTTNDYLGGSQYDCKKVGDKYECSDNCYTFSNGKEYLIEMQCQKGKASYIQKNCEEFGQQYGIDFVCSDGKCYNDPLPEKQIPKELSFPYHKDELLINPVELTSGKVKVIVPQWYESYGQKILEDLGYCLEFVPSFIGIEPYWDGVGAKVYISKSGKNQGSYAWGWIFYKRSQENINMDLQDVETNNQYGFLYKSSPTYCANSHEFTHYIVDNTILPSWANEGIAEYSQKYNQAGSKEGIDCQENGWFGFDYWSDDETNKLFLYSDLSQDFSSELGEGPKWYHTAMCFWENFDVSFGADKRKEAFQLLRNEYTAVLDSWQTYELIDGTKLEIPSETAFFIENVLFKVVDKEELKPLLMKFGFEEGVDYQ
jgi:hypothetical protein